MNADDSGVLKIDQDSLIQYNLFTHCFNNIVNNKDSTGYLVEKDVGIGGGSIGYSPRLFSRLFDKLRLNFGNGVSSITYSPINPGPLKFGISKTFSGASYTQRVLKVDTTFYRVSSDATNKVGSFMTRIPQNGRMQSQLDLALNPEWGNTAQVVSKVSVPKGTIVYEGFAAPQIINGGTGVLPGGGNQIYIPEVNPKWFK